jgi:uncharacterized protein (DUF885 family)
MRRLFATFALLVPLAAIGADTASDQARTLFERDWQWRLQHQPEYATGLGDHRYDATLSDVSPDGLRGAIAHERRMLDAARAIERAELGGQDRLSYDLFIDDKERKLAAAAIYPYDPQPLSAQDGLHIRLPQIVAQMPFATDADYRNYLARIDALPAHVDGLVEQMREGMRTGWVAPKVSVRAVPALLRAMRVELVDGSLGAPFRRMPAAIAKETRDQLSAAGPAALRTKAAPALEKLETFVRDEYLPAARESIAAGSLPDGAAWYAQAIRNATTTELAPSEIHALGLKEVARIRAAMGGAIARTGFRGSFAEFLKFARSDPRLFYTRPELLLARYRRTIARASARLPALFDALPAEPLVVKEMQRAGAAQQAAAYYEAGSPQRSAALVVNTSLLHTRPMWMIETLALHEALPGHHLQVARAHDIDGLPAFRRFGWNVAYGEGWALYAETLGPQLGFFRDPFSAFGHLNDELFRAARLVVDTGIHAFGWSRQQALDYLNANTANPPSDNEAEVDRYIARPGQALGYKIGQLRLQALRDKARAALGLRFDQRRFHAAVLDNGPLPLAMLEREVKRWIAAEAGAANAAPAAAPPAAAPVPDKPPDGAQPGTPPADAGPDQPPAGANASLSTSFPRRREPNSHAQRQSHDSKAAG